MSKEIRDKQEILNYLWSHSRFCSSRLYECEEMYKEKYGHIAILMLFSCFENICRSVANDYDSSSYCVYLKLKEQQLISETEYNFINLKKFCLRKIRNLFAHANLGSINLIIDDNGKTVLWPLTENETALLLYELISSIVFNLIFKIASSTFTIDVSQQFSFDLDNMVSNCNLKFKTLTSQELLVLKGYPKEYITDDLNMPEETKIRLIDNAPDVNAITYILKKSIFDKDNKDEF